jgi:hypothetical protein
MASRIERQRKTIDFTLSYLLRRGVGSLPMIFILDRNGIVRNRILGQVEIGYLGKAVLNLL